MIIPLIVKNGIDRTFSSNVVSPREY